MGLPLPTLMDLPVAHLCRTASYSNKVMRPSPKRENRGWGDCVDCRGMWMDKNAINAGILKEHIG